MEEEKLLFKAFRFRIGIISILLCFQLVYTPLLSYGFDFQGALDQGKSLGGEDIEKYSPSNLDATLGGKGLGTSKGNVPHIERAETSQQGYTQYYTNSGGISDGGDNQSRAFLNESYEQRQKFDLSRDPTFGNQCLQRDSQNRCAMWSSSGDQITKTYPDCEKVVIPRYEEVVERTCTGTSRVENYECDVRSIVSVITEEVEGPCNQVVIDHRPGQIYAVCRDYVTGYRVIKQNLACFAGHYAYARYVLCSACQTMPPESACSYCYGSSCPSDFFVLQNESELPPGAQFIGRGVTNVTVGGSSGRRVAYGSLSDFYATRRSVIERVIVSLDSPCGANFEKWLSECAIDDYYKCDSFGLNCVSIIKDGELTGRTVDKQCQSFASTIEEYETRNCQYRCSSDYRMCREDCTGCEECGSCEDARMVCRGGCDSIEQDCRDLCLSGYQSCIGECGTNQSCKDNCETAYNSCQANCDVNKNDCYGECEGQYQSCLPCLASCQNQLCTVECENVTVGSSYQICSLPDSSQGIEINRALATKTPYINTFTTTQPNGFEITWQTVLGGPGVRESLNDWWSKVKFACNNENTGTCQDLEAQGCYLYGSRCLNTACDQVEYTYRCGRGGVTGYTVAYNCAGEIRCMGTECVDASYEANTDFPSVLAVMEVLNQYRVDSEGNSIFPGEKRECVRTEGCCNSASGGVTISDYVNAARNVIELYSYTTGAYGTTWAGYANAFTYVLTGGEAGSLSGLLGTSVSEFLGTTTSTLWTSSGTIVGEAAVHIGAEVAVEGAVTTVTIDTALISTLATLATVVTIVLVVYSIVKFLWDWYFECKKEDIITSSKVKLGLCHRVGERCCKKLVGVCTKHCRVYCCFNSILARIVHQQGRPQVGIAWGNVSNPNCRGFTPEELASIDFSKIDFTEYIQHIKYKKEISPEEQQAITDRIKTRYGQ